MLLRMRAVVLVALVATSCGACATAFAQCYTATSYALDLREVWDKPELAFFDIRAASVTKIGSQFQFAITVWDQLPRQLTSSYGFEVKADASPTILVFEASMATAGSPGWRLRKGHRSEGEASAELTPLCTACVRTAGDTLTFEIPADELGSATSFSWSAYSRYKPGTVQLSDRVPDGEQVVSWPVGGPADSCSCFQVGILTDRPQYKIGDFATISLYVTTDAVLYVTDVSGGVTSMLGRGSVKAGLHDLSSLSFLKGAKFVAAPPLGPEEIWIVVQAAGGCERRGVTRFVVVK